MLRTSCHRVAMFAAAAALSFTGCSSDPSVPAPKAGADNLQKIQAAYIAAYQKLRRPPKDKEEIKPFFPQGTDAAAVYKSANDGQEFVIVWGAVPLSKTAEPVVIGYERQGAGGKRTCFTSMGVMELHDEDFATAKFPPGHRPQ